MVLLGKPFIKIENAEEEIPYSQKNQQDAPGLGWGQPRDEGTAIIPADEFDAKTPYTIGNQIDGYPVWAMLFDRKEKKHAGKKEEKYRLKKVGWNHLGGRGFELYPKPSIGLDAIAASL